MAMIDDDIGMPPGLDALGKLYKQTAQERSSAAADAMILQLAHAHARRRRSLTRWQLAIGAAAAMIVMAIAAIWNEQRAASAAASTHYEQVTREYLLTMGRETQDVSVTTRFLLDLDEHK
jgi:hypothetical protein